MLRPRAGRGEIVEVRRKWWSQSPRHTWVLPRESGKAFVGMKQSGEDRQIVDSRRSNALDQAVCGGKDRLRYRIGQPPNRFFVQSGRRRRTCLGGSLCNQISSFSCKAAVTNDQIPVARKEPDRKGPMRIPVGHFAVAAGDIGKGHRNRRSSWIYSTIQS